MGVIALVRCCGLGCGVVSGTYASPTDAHPGPDAHPGFDAYAHAYVNSAAYGHAYSDTNLGADSGSDTGGPRGTGRNGQGG